MDIDHISAVFARYGTRYKYFAVFRGAVDITSTTWWSEGDDHVSYGWDLRVQAVGSDVLRFSVTDADAEGPAGTPATASDLPDLFGAASSEEIDHDLPVLGLLVGRFAGDATPDMNGVMVLIFDQDAGGWSLYTGSLVRWAKGRLAGEPETPDDTAADAKGPPPSSRDDLPAHAGPETGEDFLALALEKAGVPDESGAFEALSAAARIACGRANHFGFGSDEHQEAHGAWAQWRSRWWSIRGASPRADDPTTGDEALAFSNGSRLTQRALSETGPCPPSPPIKEGAAGADDGPDPSGQPRRPPNKYWEAAKSSAATQEIMTFADRVARGLVKMQSLLPGHWLADAPAYDAAMIGRYLGQLETIPRGPDDAWPDGPWPWHSEADAPQSRDEQGPSVLEEAAHKAAGEGMALIRGVANRVLEEIEKKNPNIQHDKQMDLIKIYGDAMAGIVRALAVGARGGR